MNQSIENPLHCDVELGVCGVSSETEAFVETPPQTQPLHIFYFTDPICSSCWGIEPQLRKLKLEYGHLFQIHYHMGGLLPDWNYNKGGISKPSDVAVHWDEVSDYYQMPIDGNVWLEDPLPSSYPPSIAFKAAQIQDEQKAIRFLRRIREMVFLEKKNITKHAFLTQAAQEVGLDGDLLLHDMTGKGLALFQEDLALTRQCAIQGFPTFFIHNQAQQVKTVFGFKPYQIFEKAILELLPVAQKKAITVERVLQTYQSLTAKEYAILTNCSLKEAEEDLEALVQTQQLSRLSTPKGNLWRKNTITT